MEQISVKIVFKFFVESVVGREKKMFVFLKSEVENNCNQVNEF